MKTVFSTISKMMNVPINLFGGPSMLKFLFRRILAAIPVLFAIMVMTFGLSHALPGGPFDAVNQRKVPDHIRLQLEQRYGLNKRLFFDTPTDSKGAETAWGEQVFIKGGYGVETASEGNYPEIDSNTGITIVKDFGLYRWDEATQQYYSYEEYPYHTWAAENRNLVSTVDTLTSLTASVSNPSFSIMASGEALISRSITSNRLIDDLANDFEDCSPYRQFPGWALAAKRTECVTVGGNLSGQVTNKAQEVWRIDPLDSQFWNYMWNVVNLDFGPSLNIAQLQENTQVGDEISRRLPVSMEIGVISVIFGFLLGIPLGVLAAIYHNSVIDYSATFFAVLGQSIPVFVLAPILIIVFSVELELLPTPQRDVWINTSFFSREHLSALVLPTGVLAVGMSAGIARLTRASLLQVLGEDYIRTARSKGLRERTIIYLHALKNSLIPVATILGPLLAALLTGTFIVELIFLVPGLGSSFINSVGARDYTTLMAVTLIFSTFLIAGNILVDIIYTWLDPRIRFD